MSLSIKTKILEWKRILQVAKKPAKDEYLSSTRICVIGITIIGVIGFAVFLGFAFLGL
ncbi:MAG: protein translocase SEC61 complex subunit gamma [Candidatus Aenigmarchaeota archaeon]|nr:protein translocase SEC61 complex subunit gamma [Candidatus Aenigmarchaeota archaeon]